MHIKITWFEVRLPMYQMVTNSTVFQKKFNH